MFRKTIGLVLESFQFNYNCDSEQDQPSEVKFSRSVVRLLNLDFHMCCRLRRPTLFQSQVGSRLPMQLHLVRMNRC